MSARSATRRFGRYTVELSSLDKPYFPDDGISKGEVVDYYAAVAPLMLRHLKGRALTLHRFPDGIGEEGFYQQAAGDHYPDWIQTARLEKREGGAVEHVVCDKAASLVYLANQGTITPHAWLSRVDAPDCPDLMLFDLDPPSDDAVDLVQLAARTIREILEDIGLTAFVKTSGSRGLHVAVPLDRKACFDRVRDFARDVAAVAAAREPGKLTVAQRKDKRSGRLFLDILRNAYGQTAVAPFALRARPGAPVALPLDWETALGRDFAPRRWNLREIVKTVEDFDDPWAGIYGRGKSLTGPRGLLNEFPEIGGKAGGEE